MTSHVHTIIPSSTSCSSLSTRLMTVRRRNLGWSHTQRIAAEIAATAVTEGITKTEATAKFAAATSASSPDLHRPSASHILQHNDYPATIPARIDIHPEHHERTASRPQQMNGMTWDDDTQHVIMNTQETLHTKHETERDNKIRLKIAMSSVTNDFVAQQQIRREEETARRQDQSWAIAMEQKQRRQRPASAPMIQRHPYAYDTRRIDRDAPHVELVNTTATTTTDVDDEKITTAPYINKHRFTPVTTTSESEHFTPQAWSRVPRTSTEIDTVLESDVPDFSSTHHAIDDMSEDEEDEDEKTTDDATGALSDVTIRRRMAQERRRARQTAREEEEADARREWLESRREERCVAATKQVEWNETKLGITPLGIVEEDPAIARQAIKDAAIKKELEIIEEKKRKKAAALLAIQQQFQNPHQKNKKSTKKKKKIIPSITNTLARQVEKTLIQRTREHEQEQKMEQVMIQHHHTLETGVIQGIQSRSFDVAFGKNVIRSTKKNTPSRILSQDVHVTLIKTEKKKKEKEEKENIKPRPYSGSYQRAVEHGKQQNKI